jgi:Kef-type K+ transport system membrane component KefB
MRQLILLVILYLAMVVLPAVPGGLSAQSPLFTTTVLGFILLASLFLGRVAADFGFPMITGYLVGGMICGPWGLKLFSVEDVHRLEFINHLALSLIALSGGAELEWSMLKKRMKNIMAFSVSQMAVIFIGVFSGFYILFQFGLFESVADSRYGVYAAIFLGVIATANSPSSVVAVINELNARGPLAQTVLGVSVVKDVLVIALFAFAASFVNTALAGASGISAGEIFGSIMAETFLSLLAGALIGIMVVFFLNTLKQKQLLFTLGLAVFCSEFSSLFHLNALLLCIMAGFMVTNFSEGGGRFREGLERGSMPVFVIFFALTGASLHLDAFFEMWPAALLLVACRAFFLWVSTTGTAALMGEAPKIRKHLWTGFTAQAGVSLGLAVIIESDFPGWGGRLFTLIIAAIAINQLVGPPLFKYSLLACGEKRGSEKNGKN